MQTMNAPADSNLREWTEIPGLTTPQRELLHASGVPTIMALARHDARKLWRWMQEVNAEEHHTRQMPSLEQVTEWVRLAARLTPLQAADAGLA